MPDTGIEAIKDEIKKKQADFATVFGVMDRDEGIRVRTAYQMKDEDSKAIDGVVNYTTSEGQIYGKRVESVISSATPIIEITPIDITEAQCRKIELFINTAFSRANHNLALRGMRPFHTTQGSLVPFRGRCGQRVVAWKSTGKAVDFDITPMDMRNVTYEYGRDGMLWYAYQFPMSKTQIKEEYNKTIDKDSTNVVDYWSRQKNYIFDWESGTIFRQGANKAGKVPASIKIVGSSSDSIYSAVRDTYDRLNMHGSIMDTISMLAMRPPLAVKSEKGNKSIKEYPAIYAMMTKLAKEESIEKIPFTEMYNYCELRWNHLMQEIQRGSLPFSEYGGYPTTEFSALFLDKLEQHRDQVFIPLLQALEDLYIDTAWLLIDQFINKGHQTKVQDERGKDITIRPTDLKGQYEIAFILSTVTPERNIANYSVANAARTLGITDYTIYRKILRLEDPEAEEQRKMSQRAMETYEEFFLTRLSRDLTKAAETLQGDAKKEKLEEAKLANERLKSVIAMRDAMAQQTGGGPGTGGPAMPGTNLPQAAVRGSKPPAPMDMFGPQGGSPPLLPPNATPKTGQEKLQTASLGRQGLRAVRG